MLISNLAFLAVLASNVNAALYVNYFGQKNCQLRAFGTTRIDSGTSVNVDTSHSTSISVQTQYDKPCKQAKAILYHTTQCNSAKEKAYATRFYAFSGGDSTGELATACLDYTNTTCATVSCSKY